MFTETELAFCWQTSHFWVDAYIAVSWNKANWKGLKSVGTISPVAHRKVLFLEERVWGRSGAEHQIEKKHQVLGNSNGVRAWPVPCLVLLLKNTNFPYLFCKFNEYFNIDQIILGKKKKKTIEFPRIRLCHTSALLFTSCETMCLLISVKRERGQTG